MVAKQLKKGYRNRTLMRHRLIYALKLIKNKFLVITQGNGYFNVRSEETVLFIVIIFRFLVSMLTQSIQFNSLTILVCLTRLFCFYNF